MSIAKKTGHWLRGTLAAVLLAFAPHAHSQQYFEYKIESNPQEIIPTSTGYVPAGTPAPTPNISYGQTDNYYFEYWTINGVPQRGVLGEALTLVTLPMTNAEVAVAQFAPAGDSTASGLQDWYQWFWFGTTSNNAGSDPTGDGFTIADDIARDYSPVIANVTTSGGAILRLSDLVTVVPTVIVKVLPFITALPSASPITYGQQLGDSILSGGGASVPGVFAFASPTNAPSAGTNIESIIFIPSDTNDYTFVITNVTVAVLPATPTIITPPTPCLLTYGQPLSFCSCVGVASVPGSFAWASPSNIPPVGSSYQTVIFTPSDMNDYLLLYTNVAVTIGQELPVIVTLPVASAITYGQSLSNAVLSGGAASAPGIFAFTFPGFTPSAGTSNQSVTFAPADTTNFASVSTNVLVTVYRAPPKIISAPVVSPITFGQALSNSVLNAGIASVPGIFAFTTPSASPVAGSNIESVIFLPTDAVDFTTAIFGSVAQFVGF